jgi:general secretion pathway protein C
MAIGLAGPIQRGKVGLDQIILAAELLLAALLLLLFVKIAFLFVKPGGGQVVAPTNTGLVNSTNTPAQIDKSVLMNFDPFHREQVGVTIIQTNSAPETTLDLAVFGMRADLKGETSSAIIETPDGKQATYFLGDTIIPGVTLKSVEIDFVTLDRNGKTERLSREGKKDGEIPVLSTVELSTLSFPAADMIKDVRFYPHREGKSVIGYRVMPQRSGKKKLEEYGFQRGDIVTAINGEDLTQNIVNLPALFKNLKQARYANIQIIRDDVPMTIEVNLK